MTSAWTMVLSLLVRLTRRTRASGVSEQASTALPTIFKSASQIALDSKRLSGSVSSFSISSSTDSSEARSFWLS